MKIICEDTGEQFNQYYDYMQSRHWRLKKAAFKKSKLYFGRCHVCKSDEKGLHIHHKTYTRVGKEHLSDLVCLCEKCHYELHDLMNEKDKSKRSTKVRNQTLLRKMRKQHERKNKCKNSQKNGRKLTKQQKSNKEWLAQNYQ